MENQEKALTVIKNSEQQLGSLQMFAFEKTPVFATLKATGGVVALKSVVENLGLSWPAQQRVIKNDHNLNQLLLSCPSVGPDGRVREMLCMKQNDFQDWLWSLNPKSPNFKTDLWETYKKGLVIYLMSMLKMSMDKIQEIQGENSVLKEIKALTAGINQLKSELSDNQERNKEIRKELKALEAHLNQVINQNPNQMKLAI
jgi:hypothetical protein